jgi:imidazolonepropionase-like amidohydrolase
MADSVGTVAPGKVADLIAVEGDPLTDPSAFQRIRFVMQGGRTFVAPGTVRR